MPTDNKTIGRQFMEGVLGKGDWSAAAEIVSSDVIMHHPSSPEPVRGFEQVKGFLTAFRTGFPDLQMHVEDVIADGNKALARWTATGTHNGNLFGIPPSGRSMRVSGMSLFRIENGKIVEDWVSEDSLGLMQQIGVIPTPGQ